ncbi:MAG: polysaccharide biosynthesis tyrosine autokinase [Armatimonadota bacterium]
MRRDQNNNQQNQNNTGIQEESSFYDNEVVDLHEYLNIFFRRYRLMIITIGLVFIIGMIYTIRQDPVFESTAKVFVVTDGARSYAYNDIPLISDLQALTKNRSIDTQIDIILSPEIIDKAYDKLIDPDVIAKAYENLSPESAIAKKYPKLLSIPRIRIDLYTDKNHLNQLENENYSLQIVNVPENERILLNEDIKNKEQELIREYERKISDRRNQTDIKGTYTKLKEYVRLKEYDMQDMYLKKHNLNHVLKDTGFYSEEAPSWAYQVSAKKNTDIVAITGLAYSAEAAAAFANSIANTYLLNDFENSKAETSKAREFAENQVSDLRMELDDANARLSRFKQRNGIISSDTQFAKIAEHMAKLQLDVDASNVEIASSEKEINTLEKEISGQSEHVVSSSTVARNPDFNGIKESLNVLYSKKASMLQEFLPASPEMKAIDDQIKAEEARLKQVTENIVSSETETRNPVLDELTSKYSDALAKREAYKARVAAISSAYQQRKTESSVLPEREKELQDLMQEVALLGSTYEMLTQKYYTLLLSENSMMVNGQTVSEAKNPLSQSYPSKRKNAVLYLLLGTMISIGVALIAEKIDIRLHDQSIAERIAGVPTLSVIPEIPEDTSNIISDANRNSLLLESYRILRNNISFSSIDKEIKLLAISSPGRGEGKSTTAINLAVAMAMDGKRVLIMDCDLRRPSVHRKLAVSRDIGFTNVVTGACKLEDAIAPTNIENLSLLPSGPIPPNPTEVLNSHRSREIFQQVSEMYDLVIVDSPPCVGLSDVQVLANLVDGMILLVAMDQTLKPHMHIAMRTLKQVDAPLIGIVLNRMELRRQGYNSYYSYYYYYSYDYTQDSENSDSPSIIKKKKKRSSRSNKK